MEAYAQALLIAIPGFIVLMLLELAVGVLKGENTYTVLDTVSSISSGLTNILKDSLGLAFVLVSYPFLVGNLSLFTWTDTSILAYILAFIAIDLAGYWSHRLNHKVNVFWNLHVIHHSSEEFNLACALRQPISNIIAFTAIFLIPAALIGIPTEMIAVLAPLHLFLQFWYHTKHIGKLGWLEYVLVTPSQHRVHHAINEPYLDKNLAPIFSIWDRMFGTFQEELDHEPAVYGTLKPASTWNPFIINFQHFLVIAKDAWRTRSWKDKLRIWFMPTGWRPADVIEKYPIEIVTDPFAQQKYKTTFSPFFSWYFVGQMLSSLAAVLFLFYFYGDMSTSQLLILGAFIALSIFSYTSFMDRYSWAGHLEVIRCVLILLFIQFTADGAALLGFSPILYTCLTAYVILTLGLTVYFAFLDGRYATHPKSVA